MERYLVGVAIVQGEFMRPVCLSSRVVRSGAPATVAAYVAFTFALAAISGCGGSGGGSTNPPIPVGNTKVSVEVASSANDRLSQFYLGLTGLTLTSQSGKTVTLFSSATGTNAYNPEFIHLNSAASSLATASVPDDTYTSATLTAGSASFTCLTLDPASQSLYNSTYAYGQTPQSQVTVNLPSPITVTGDTMTLLLQLQVAQSATLGQCDSTAPNNYTITPTFSLSALELAPQPTNYENGKQAAVYGEVSSVTAGSGFAVELGYSLNNPAWQTPVNIGATSSTVYQGIGGLSSLTAGMFVDMDLALQADGSLVASRVAMHDPNAVDVIAGPAEFIDASQPVLLVFGQQVEGPDQLGNSMYFDASKATYSISQVMSNLANLPFTPVFASSNIVPGQQVYVTTPASTVTGINHYPMSNTITLAPQSIDGTVTAVSSSGGFDVYTVSLASYDLFSDLASQPGQTSLIGQPNLVQVYVDDSTQLLNGAVPAVGAILRFHGLVFNDQGTLRMDCDLADSGVGQ
jgi:hypothetical protein